MHKKLTDSQNVFVVSSLAWALIACVVNLIGNAIPVFFLYQEYFVVLALIALGLGFFTRRTASGTTGAIADNASKQDSEAAEEQGESVSVEAAGESAPVHASAPAMALSQTEKVTSWKSGWISDWLLWLFILLLTLAAVTLHGYPKGVSSAIGLVLSSIFTYVDHNDFIKGPLQYELASIFIILTLFVALIRVFRPFGAELAVRSSTLSAGMLFALAAAGAAVGWAIFVACTVLGVPPALLLAAALIAAAIFNCPASRFRIVLSAVSILLGALVSTYGIVAPKAGIPEEQKACYSTRWANGSRIDSLPLMHDAKLLGVVVNVDHLLYQILPSADVNADDMRYLHATYGLPEFPIDYRALPYLAMPEFKAKKALILGSGLGTHISQALAQKIATIHAVERQQWLIELAKKIPFGPYSSPAVTAIIEDPRQYLRNAIDKYDLILFTAEGTSCQANPFIIERPDLFLTTGEAFCDVRDHLNPGGKVVVEYSEANPWCQTFIATNLIKVFLDSGKHEKFADLTAELKSPYTSFLIATNPPRNDDTADKNTKMMLSTYGPKVARDPVKLRDACRDLPPLVDDLPFMLSLAPSLPMSDMFLINMLLLVVLMSIRMYQHEPILSAINRRTWSIMTIAAVFILAMVKATVTLTYINGYSTAGSLSTVSISWLILAIIAFARSRVSMPAWAVWLFFFATLFGEYQFNYQSIPGTPDQLLRFVQSSLLPYAPVSGSALLLSHYLIKAEPCRANFGFAFFGMALGCVLQLFAVFAGISTIDLLSATLAAITLLMQFGGQSGKKKVHTPIPQATT